MKINFDMDGTLCDFYGQPYWLGCLENELTRPYRCAEPRVNMRKFVWLVKKLQSLGYEVGIISWLSKSGSPTYNERVTETKLKWLARHCGSITWDSITIVPYGTPKEQFCDSPEDWLFDDELRNRENWTGIAFDVGAILETLGKLI